MFLLIPLGALLWAAGPLQGASQAQAQQTQSQQTGTSPSSAAATSTPKPGVIRGHVYSSDTGAGVKHADVSLRPTARFQPQEANTDAQGGFEFRNVDPGQY